MFIPHHPLYSSCCSVCDSVFPLRWSRMAKRTHIQHSTNHPLISIVVHFDLKNSEKNMPSEESIRHVTIDDVDLQIYNIIKMYKRLRSVCVCESNGFMLWILFGTFLVLFFFFFIFLLTKVDVKYLIKGGSFQTQNIFRSVPFRADTLYNFIALFD